jgi:hypothetical protein
MAFFENLSKKVGEAAQTAAKKSGDLIEISKLSMSINSEEDKIQKAYEQIGKAVYEKFTAKQEVPSDFIASCEIIVAIEKTIIEIREKIAVVKNVKACTNCAAEIERDVAFCAKCGAKQTDPQNTPEGKVCSGCGVQLAESTAFCTSCGAKV